MQNQQVWFITGASKGLGLELVKQLLQSGHRVAATSRDVGELQRVVGTESVDYLPMMVDLTAEDSVKKAIQTTIEVFGRIDVVVNNAGYGQLGSLEELTDEEARNNFDVNVFGMLHVIRQVMPQLREQGSGHFLNISSIAGITGAFPGWGIYCATKFAVEGLSESLAAEVAPFGVNVTLVEPGYFRTDFLSSGSMQVARHPVDAYRLVRESDAIHQQQIRGNQPGDPVKAASAMIQIAAEPNPPMHLLLGPDAFGMAENKIKALQADMDQWKAMSMSTNFTEPISA